MIIDLTPVRDRTGPSRLIDLVPGRSKAVFTDWLNEQTPQFRAGIEVVAMDGFTGFRTAAAEALPDADAVAVMDPFHVVALAGDALELCRQRVQQETLGHRGRSGDPLYKVRRALRTGIEPLTWALEGTGSFAAGLATVLAEAGEDTIEITGGRRTRGAKSDRIDAVAAARTALASEHQATPRARGLREALRQILVTRQAVLVSRTKAINELKSLIVVAPEHLRAGLRGVALAGQLDRVDALTSPEGAEVEHRVTVITLRSIAARIRFLLGQTAELDRELAALVRTHPAGPALLSEPGVGPVVVAQLLVSWSHRGRVRSESAFAALAGVSPLEASSGQRARHRLNRGGDRDLNRALHTVAITRMRCHPETRAYELKRTTEGRTHKEIRRSLKRTLARRLYRCIQTATRPAEGTLVSP